MQNIILFSVIVSFALSAAVIPLIICACKKFGWYDSTNERKIHKGFIPRLGAVGFVPAIFAAAVFFCANYPESRPLEYMPLVIGGALIFIFGVVDDFKDLSPRKKLLVQIIATVLMLFSGKRFYTLGDFILPVPVSYALTFLWIAGLINAFNLIDGVDGLCGGLSALIFCALGVIYVHPSPTLAAFCFIIAGGLGGFLLYNKPKASIFMGDGGSQFLGFMIAALPLYRSGSSFEINKAFSMVLLTCIPVLDTVTAMIRRKREHRSFFSPDRAHLHHKLMNLGLSSVQILVLLLAVQALLCTTVCVSLLFSTAVAALLQCAVWLVVAGLFCILHYLNRTAMAKKENPDAYFLSSSGGKLQTAGVSGKNFGPPPPPPPHL